ncbi:hypothetical protein F2Q70_00021115 [Brassica cretica]|uniref:Uncharacterized protein n=1 Tax=Brassica cretica TaxID=69181 RepID=A0A8S9GKZ0_BRACR|nr:hypothetical protein F2Q70_00021115 [Brassica cretica]KAF2555752.1 hypothetical protein F2Q68_00014608 [Brassica cretica]
MGTSSSDVVPDPDVSSNRHPPSDDAFEKGETLQENTPNSDGGSDGHQSRRTFVTDYRPISDEIQKIEVVGIPSAISDGIPTKQGSSEFSDDFSTSFR